MMNPATLHRTLTTLIERSIRLSVMIWGPPGVGKSSVVARVAQEREMGFIDLRLGQLAPTDLRGLPVAEGGVARWLPPEFLPTSGRGVLFLDEINMAPPLMQGIAQQLVLDRRVGSYTVPDGWFVWAAGNRREDRAGVFEMPAPLANRFLHLEVGPDLEAFRAYAIAAGIAESIIAFVTFRPELLHRLDPQRPAWPSPRSWEMASALLAAGLDASAAVGPAAAAELRSFTAVYTQLADLDRVLAGQADAVPFPTEPSRRYASVVALGMRAAEPPQIVASFRWLGRHAAAEWLQLFMSTLIARAKARGAMGELAACLAIAPEMKAFIRDYHALIAG